MVSPSTKLLVVATAAATTLGAAATLAGGADATVRNTSYCHFPHDQEGDHVITFRRDVSCADALTILRRLRGNRVLIPMACHHERHIRGWRLRNDGLEWDVVATTYARGNVRIVYERNGHPEIQCVDVPPFQSDE